jgi:AbrB family looped-hinge helix DNA binding protein
MKVTVKGQVTIPKEFREKHGIAPGTEVEFFSEGSELVVRRISPQSRREEVRQWIDCVAGTSDTGMTTDEIMALTRGED